MSAIMEKQEGNNVKLTLKISPERFEEGMQDSYKKNRTKISLPGFRKGKAPRALIEKQYGKEVFMDDAINFVFPDAYDDAIEEFSLEPVARPVLEEANEGEDGLTLVLTVVVKPEVTLGKYKGLSYDDVPAEVSDEEINETLEAEREKNARMISVSDRPIAEGDTAVIDFEGFIDDVAFEGGKGEDYELVIGSHTFIDTFEDQLVGKNLADDVDVFVTFPENYGQEELASKPAHFKVEIKDILMKELPELDDDFAQDVSEFDTLNEYKDDIKAKLLKRKEKERESAIEDQLIEQASNNATVDVPVEMVETQMNQMLQEFANRVSQQGLDFATFLQYSGQDVQTFRENYREQASKNVRARLVLEAIALDSGIEPSEEDIDEEIKRIAQNYEIEEENIRTMLKEDDIKGLKIDLKTQKALELLVKEATVKVAE